MTPKIGIKRTIPVARLEPEFDDFLFASIGTARNGMSLSVLSALARHDVDPWQEAAKLVELSKDAATRKLASLIALLSDPPTARQDAETIAARLITLLPRRAGSSPSPRDPSDATATPAKSKSTMNVYVLIVAAMLGAQCVIAALQPSTQSDNTHGPIVNAYYPQTPPISGQ